MQYFVYILCIYVICIMVKICQLNVLAVTSSSYYRFYIVAARFAD